MIDLIQIQQEHREWTTKNFGEQKTHQMIYGLIEELGELAHAQLKYEQGIRGYDRERFVSERNDSIGDIVIYLMGYCNVEGEELENIITEVWNKVKQRNWKEDSQNGGEA